MNKAATIQARIDPELKAQGDAILHSLGLNSSQAVNAFYAQIVLHRGIPFDLKIPNKLTQKTLEASAQGNNIKQFDSADALFDDLRI